MLRELKDALRLRTRYRAWAAAVAGLGWREALLFPHHRAGRTPRSRAGVYSLRPRHARYPLRVRSGTTDVEVFRQIFVEREYSCLDDLREVGLVLDCGANVGYSSAYFLSRWPDAEVIAVEPDPGNFEMLRENLAPYGARAKPVRAGIWSHPCELRLAEAEYRGGGEWARQVRECAPGERGEISAVDIPSLLEGSGHDRISVLKIDIEGAEAVVFGGRCDWLDRVDNLVIELHDDSQFGNCSAVFQRAIEGRGFELGASGELTVCRRPSAT